MRGYFSDPFQKSRLRLLASKRLHHDGGEVSMGFNQALQFLEVVVVKGKGCPHQSSGNTVGFYAREQMTVQGMRLS